MRIIRSRHALLLAGLFLFAFLLPVSVSTQTKTDLTKEIEKQNTAFAGPSGANYGNIDDPRVIVARLVQTFLTFIGTIYLFYTVYGGYLIMTALGREDRVEKGSSIVRNGAIGIVITLMSYSIAYFVYLVIWSSQTPSLSTYVNWGLLPDVSGYYNQDHLEQSNLDSVLPPKK